MTNIFSLPKFTAAETLVISETRRRLTQFHKGNVNNNLILLAYPSEVKTLISKGYFVPHSNEIKRALNWYNLTNKGKGYFLPTTITNQ